jgi:hypothetical protein
MRWRVERSLVTGCRAVQPRVKARRILNYLRPDYKCGDEDDLQLFQPLANFPWKRYPTLVIPRSRLACGKWKKE